MQPAILIFYFANSVSVPIGMNLKFHNLQADCPVFGISTMAMEKKFWLHKKDLICQKALSPNKESFVLKSLKFCETKDKAFWGTQMQWVICYLVSWGISWSPTSSLL